MSADSAPRRPKPAPKSEQPTRAPMFEVREQPRGPLSLVVESPERFEIRLNDTEINNDNDAGWWVDPALRLLPFDNANLRPGINSLRLSTTFREDSDIEAAYILGEFHAQTKGTNVIIDGDAKALGLGDWTRRGLPFYGGAIAYRFQTTPTPQKGERVMLSAPDFNGAMIRVLINGMDAGYLAWPPYETDITKFLRPGVPAEITLELFGSRRNTFGPLHQTNLNPHWIWPHNFVTEGADWSDGYRVKPCGLMKPPQLLYQK